MRSDTALVKTDPERKDVWVADAEHGYLAAHVVKEVGDESVVSLSNGQSQTVPTALLSPMNPPKFEKADDIADLTYLNEASVVHNLRQRYFSSLIYVRARDSPDLLGPVLGGGQSVPRAAYLYGCCGGAVQRQAA